MEYHGYVSLIEVIKLFFELDIIFEHINLKEYNPENQIKEKKELYKDEDDIIVLFSIE